MWAHTPWIGHFLSPGNRGRELLEYSRWCNSVEGNTTFYAVPAPRTIDRWAEQAPRWFRFAFKLPRSITHERRLRDAEAETAEFLDRIGPLGDRIGPIQIQLPPSFGPDSLSALRDFIAILPDDQCWTIELRHPSFFDGGPAHAATDEMLADAHIGRIVLDTRPLYAASPRTDAAVDERRTKPRLPVVVVDGVGPVPIVRVIGNDDPDATMIGLTEWIPTIAAWIDDGRQPYVFVHQPENLDSPRLARRVHAAVAAVVPGLEPLPDPLPIVPSSEVTGQSSLF